MAGKIRVSEIFYSLQGEGLYVGVPSVFLRVWQCNFQCPAFGTNITSDVDNYDYQPNQEVNDVVLNAKNYKDYRDLPLVTTGCDSYASWHPAFKHLSPVLTVDQVAAKIKELLPDGKFSKDKHLVITGGEPLLPGWQKCYSDLFRALNNIGTELSHVTFETNGTQAIGVPFVEMSKQYQEAIDFTFSVSPKLPSSGEHWDDAIRPDVIWQLQNELAAAVYLKFVVADLADIKWVKKAIAEYVDAGFNGAVYLMSVGGVEDVYNQHRRDVAKLAMDNGWRYSPRLQVSLWRNAWST